MSSKALLNPKRGEMYLPPTEQLRAVMDHRPVTIKGIAYDAYPHSTDATRLARNLGFTVPAPVYARYPFHDTAFETQKITAALLTMNRRAYVLNEMGTGKTRAALYACDWMLMNNEIQKVLVIAPLSTLENTWALEIMKWFPHLTSSTVYGYSPRSRLKKLKEKADIYIMNHHGVKTSLLPELKKMRFDVILIDEIAVFRNQQTDLWKAMFSLVEKAPYVWGMTGSPTPEAPTDAYAQAKLLRPTSVPKYFRAFKRGTMTQVSQFRWIPQPDATEKVHKVLQPAVRFKRDDVVELPPVSFGYNKVEQSKDQQRVYKELVSKLTVAFQEGRVTASNEGVLFSKLLQIASGWVYTKDRNIVNLNPHKRLEQLRDVIDQSEGKVIVFADYIHTADLVNQHLCDKKYQSVLVTGQTPARVRNDVFGRFQNMDSPRVIVAHPKCMAHGLTLTEASTMVWYTPTLSLETYEQACARITRPGQTRKQLILHLTGTVVESKVYRRLKEKASVQGALLDLFTEAAL